MPKPAAGPAQAATPEELVALDAIGKSGAWEVGGHSVNLTNLDKVLWPGPGYTKRDLVRYNATIAPWVLPYLRDRALNTDRWPDGITGHPDHLMVSAWTTAAWLGSDRRATLLYATTPDTFAFAI